MLGHHPRVILSGRDTNDAMGAWIADQLHKRRGGKAGSVLVMGMTFKENVPDLRNSRVVDVVRRLGELGHDVTVVDPLADADEAMREYGVTLGREARGRFDLVIGAVAHDAYRSLDARRTEALVAEGGTLADLKGLWREAALSPSLDRWTL